MFEVWPWTVPWVSVLGAWIYGVIGGARGIRIRIVCLCSVAAVAGRCWSIESRVSLLLAYSLILGCGRSMATEPENHV